MKKQLSTILTTFVLLTNTLMAEEISLPKVEVPSILQEGTQRELSAAQIAELLPWAKDSKLFLVDLLDAVQSLPMDQKIERLVDGIKTVVGESAPKQSELIMRFSLNRAIVLNDILTAETSESAVGTADAKVRVLVSSIKMALKYYDSDMAKLSNKTALPYATFGIEYFNFLNELNKSIFDASAQYNIQRTALEFLQWDLYRDLNNTTYAPQIVRINNALKIFPTKKLADNASISYIRQMKKVTEQLNLVEKVAFVQKTEEKTNIFVQQKPAIKNTSGYAVSSGACYPTDSAGNLLWRDGAVSDSRCTAQYKVASGACYAAGSKGELMYKAGAVSDSKCTVQYKVSSGACYAADGSGELMYKSGSVSDARCTKQYKVSSGACYAADSSGELMYKAGSVSDSNCTRQYKASSGACYAADSSGELLYKSGSVSDSNCTSQYKASSGYCYAADASGELLYKNGAVSSSNCR